MDGNRLGAMSADRMWADRVSSVCRITLVLGTVAILAACSAPGPVELNEAELSREAAVQRRLALQELVDTQRRIESVSFRLLKAAADFCGDRTGHGYGFTVANKYSFGPELAAAAEEVWGLDDAARILLVVPGSPADMAGIVQGDMIARIEGKPVAPDRQSVATVSRTLEKHGPRPVTLEIAGANPRRVTVAPAPVCGFSVQVLNSDKINAYADGRRVRITRGMLWFVHGETELAMVVAHELAHNVMGHAGTFRGLFEDTKSREADADQLGLFIMARAGFEIERAPNFWRRMAAAFPRMIEASASHPIMPYRFVALRKTTEEIRRLQAEGKPLVPLLVDRWANRTTGPGRPES